MELCAVDNNKFVILLGAGRLGGFGGAARGRGGGVVLLRQLQVLGQVRAARHCLVTRLQTRRPPTLLHLHTAVDSNSLMYIYIYLCKLNM